MYTPCGARVPCPAARRYSQLPRLATSLTGTAWEPRHWCGRRQFERRQEARFVATLSVLRIMINNVRNACDEFHINQTHNSIISVIRPHVLALAAAMGDYVVATGRGFYVGSRARAGHMKEVAREFGCMCWHCALWRGGGTNRGVRRCWWVTA